MNKKQIIAFLEELAVGVRGKRDHYERTILTLLGEAMKGALDGQEDSQTVEKYKSLIKDYELSLEYVKGQLYEISYILGEITRDKRKKDL